MKPVTVRVDIAAPADRVWSLVSDIERGHKAIPAIKRIEFLSDRRTGLGTRWRETRIMFGRDATEDLEITGWLPPHEYTVSATSHGCEYRSVLRVAPSGAGSTLEFEFSARPFTLSARIMGGIMLPLMRKAMVKALANDLAGIKSAAEETR